MINSLSSISLLFANLLRGSAGVLFFVVDILLVYFEIETWCSLVDVRKHPLLFMNLTGNNKQISQKKQTENKNNKTQSLEARCVSSEWDVQVYLAVSAPQICPALTVMQWSFSVLRQKLCCLTRSDQGSISSGWPGSPGGPGPSLCWCWGVEAGWFGWCWIGSYSDCPLEFVFLWSEEDTESHRLMLGGGIGLKLQEKSHLWVSNNCVI